MSNHKTLEIPQFLSEYCIRIGDTSLILGQRLAEWCGHGPILEEDIAITNISLDLIGQTRGFYSYACTLENKGRTEDDLAFLRNDRDFRNLLLSEQLNGDFARTMLRQLFLSAYQCHLFTALETSRDETLAALASKSLKEVRYHLRHSSEWIIRFGQGTEESRSRISNAIEDLWSYVEEMFDTDEIEQKLTAEGLAADSSTLRELWYSTIREIFREAGLHIPEKYNSIRGSRQGKHSEHLGHLLAEMQMLHRSFPGAEW